MTQSLYENTIWRDMQDEVMRPGGLALTNELLNQLEFQARTRVLDLGCGYGASLRFVQERFDCEVFGLDISRQLLAGDQRRPFELCLIQSDINAIPLAENTFDLILMECVVSIFGMEKMFTECKRLLKTDGKILVTDLYARKADGLHEIRKLPPGTCIQSVIMQKDIMKALDNCGLKVLYWHDYSETMKNFPMKILCTSLQINMFDLILAANSVKLGYFGMVVEN
jgi:ubiquinone/menaquinone biosynthesis C-methylase UbiE